VLTSLAERGIAVAKAVEGEPGEHTHANVSAELAAAAGSAASGGGGGGDAPGFNFELKVIKTAPRGGRKLTSRR